MPLRDRTKMACEIGLKGMKRIGRHGSCLVAVVFLSACAGELINPVKDLNRILSQQAPDTMVAPDFEFINTFVGRAVAAYEEPPEIRKRYPNTIRVAPPLETQYFAEKDTGKRVIWISVRGTANKTNTLQDLDVKFLRKNDLGIPLHYGFYRVASALYADVKPQLEQGYEIRVTGHSLGGAIAVVLAMLMEQDGYEVDQVMTFGQPKITNQRGALSQSDLPLLRVINQNDVVPRLPPSNDVRSQSYHHFGEALILINGNRYARVPSSAAPRVSVGTFWRNTNDLKVKDHRRQVYADQLTRFGAEAEEVSFEEWQNIRGRLPN